jgi:DNA-directed RNA polymerase specialized sigma24 family protein
MKRDQRKVDYEMTYDEIAQQLGVSREAVAEVCRRAEKKMRAALEQKGLKFDDIYGDL